LRGPDNPAKGVSGGFGDAVHEQDFEIRKGYEPNPLLVKAMAMLPTTKASWLRQ
jgi:hypothetical protein